MKKKERRNRKHKAIFRLSKAASIALCILEMHIIAVVGGIVGLACIGFTLYSTLKPNIKLEEIESVEQPIVSSESKDMLKNS